MFLREKYTHLDGAAVTLPGMSEHYAQLMQMQLALQRQQQAASATTPTSADVKSNKRPADG